MAKSATPSKRYPTAIGVDPYTMDLEEIYKERRALRKREKEVKKRRKASQELTKWKALTELKRKFQQELKDSGHSYGVNLSKLSTMEEYYEYQNPNNTKQKALDDSVEWVKEYIKKKDKATLIQKAQDTRYQTYMRTMKKKKKKTANITSDKKSATDGGDSQSGRGDRGISR